MLYKVFLLALVLSGCTAAPQDPIIGYWCLTSAGPIDSDRSSGEIVFGQDGSVTSPHTDAPRGVHWRALGGGHYSLEEQPGVRSQMATLNGSVLTLDEGNGRFTGEKFHCTPTAQTSSATVSASEELPYLALERPLAVVSFASAGEHNYDATIHPALDSRQQVRQMQIAGDEWRIEGDQADGVFRLTDIQGRLSGQRDAIASDVALQAAYRWHGLPELEGRRASGVFFPMADGARYEVRLTANGMIYRPVNEAAAQAIGDNPKP